jgi:hypothetical protein
MSDYTEGTVDDGTLPKPRLIVKPHVPGNHDIFEEDVVRPTNKIWCRTGSEETRTWRLKSSAGCPTYGSCDFCFSSGPVGKRCSKCPEAGFYLVVLYQYYVLDSVALADVMERGHEVAKANRTYQWHRTPTKTFNQEMARIALEKYHHQRNSREISAIIMKILDFLPQDTPRR